jgi:quinol monooxygenase YgiN
VTAPAASATPPYSAEIGLSELPSRPYSSDMILLAGTVRFPPDNVLAAREAMAAIIEGTRAEEGCVRYAFAEDVLDPGLFHIIEFWRDQAALDGHGATAHMDAWRKAAQALGLHDRNLRLYEVDEGSPR